MAGYIRCGSAGGINKMKCGVIASGSSSENYGWLTLDSDHEFSVLKIVSYINEVSLYTNYPKIRINDVDYSKPAIGTTFDIKNKSVSIVPLTINNSYVKAGVNIELY